MSIWIQSSHDSVGPIRANATLAVQDHDGGWCVKQLGEIIMHIHGPSNIHGPQPINPPHRTPGSMPSSSAPRPVQHADQLDISREAEMASRARDLPEIRADRVAEIRAQIEAGTYETEQKLEVAVGRLLDELVG